MKVTMDKGWVSFENLDICLGDSPWVGVDLEGPPCCRCVFWAPILERKPDGVSLRCCHSPEDICADFSCYKPK